MSFTRAGKHIAMKRILFFLALLSLLPSFSKAYSVLTHEAIIDGSWKNAIEPLLLQKFPGTTKGGLLEAHAYAYGGSIVLDIGYYPFGSKLFTNLVHNVRTGDFITALIDEAQTLNEYAFALGALSHYMADNYGHSLATNVVVPLVFSKIKSKYGNTVTYADHKKSHSIIEFGFDLLQIARENYATKAHRDFIGFKVSKNILEKAFFKTYGVYMGDVFSNISLAITSFRWSVKTLFPTVIKAALINKKAEIVNTAPGTAGHNFSLKMKNNLHVYQGEGGYENAGVTANLLSAILPVLPKVGPLSKLRFKPLSAEAEKLFVESFDSTLVHYAAALLKIQAGELNLTNRILDTGNEIIAGEYNIADSNYDALLLMLNDNNYDNLTTDTKHNLISFYSKWKPCKSGKRNVQKQAKIRSALTVLRSAPAKESTSVLSYEKVD